VREASLFNVGTQRSFIRWSLVIYLRSPEINCRLEYLYYLTIGWFYLSTKVEYSRAGNNLYLYIQVIGIVQFKSAPVV